MKTHDPSFRFRIIGFQCSFIADQGYNNIAVICVILFFYNDHIALIDTGIYHGMSVCSQYKEISFTEKSNRKSNKFLKSFFRQFG